MSDTPEFLMIVTAKGAKKLADKFGSTASAATFTCAEHGEKCVTVAECAENQGYVWSYDDETHGNFAIKVDGEEIDHADTRAEAKRHRNAIIYGEIGTEANTTIEPRS